MRTEENLVEFADETEFVEAVEGEVAHILAWLLRRTCVAALSARWRTKGRGIETVQCLDVSEC